MSDNHRPIHWNPRFQVLSDKAGLFFIGERTSFFYQGPLFAELFSKIDGARTAEEITDGYKNVHTKAMLLHTINGLIKQGLLVEKQEEQRETTYHQPDFQREFISIQSNSEKAEFKVLTQFGTDEYWHSRSATIDTSIVIVLVDDYLDPRLDAINREYLESGRPWLLIKPTGEQPIIGPFFRPEIKNSPCWQCLAVRLRHNQPVRRWKERQQQGDTFPIPIAYDEQRIKKAVDFALKQAPTLAKQKGENNRFELQTIEPTTIKHPVSYRPQCPHCGDPALMKKQGYSPVQLHSGMKKYVTDGGSRTIVPGKTIKNLQASISPLTGIICDVSLLPDQKEEGILIFRSVYFKTPGLQQKQFSNSDFVQFSLGKGIFEEQSKAGALCESLERYSARYQGDEPIVWGRPDQLTTRAILPNQLATFSKNQYASFNDPNHPESQSRHAVLEYSAEDSLPWTPGWSLSRNELCYLPATFCYSGTPFQEECYSRYDSNGSAAGNTKEEAILQGMLELIERDAISFWWYNRIVCREVSTTGIPEKHLQRIDRTLNDEWDYWVLDMTGDFNIPVFGAVGRNRKTGKFRLGFGCHFDPVLSVQRAITELCQLIAIKDQGSPEFDFDEIPNKPFLNPKGDQPPKKLSEFPNTHHQDIREEILHCLKQAKALNLEVLIVNTTRPDLPIHTVKVIIPGLCHMWPRFGNKRLYQYAKEANLKEEMDETALNPVPLMI